MTSVHSIRFCEKCDNKYYHKINFPKDDTDEPTLIYYCRVCGHVDTSCKNVGTCVLDTQTSVNSVDAMPYIYNKYIKYDPTLPILTMKCPNDTCTTNEGDKEGVSDIVYIRYDTNEMKYLYVCINCDYKWNNENN